MLTTNIKTDVIDADAHVVENERVWDYLDTGEEKYRPTLLAEAGNSERQHWVLDGEDLGPKFLRPTRSNLKTISKGSAEKSKLRWKHASLAM